MRRRIHRLAETQPDVLAHMIASRQYGVIARFQALEAGLTERMIDWRLKTGEWVMLYPGVYAIRSSTPSWLRSEMGAVLWAGPDAAGSGRAAGSLWGFDGVEPGTIEVSSTRRLRHAGVIVHHTDDLGSIKHRRGIPVTDPFRTIIDLAPLIPSPNLEAALDSGLRAGLLHLNRLERLLEAAGRRRGVAHLKNLVGERLGCIGLTRSELEALVSDFLRNYGIPGGHRNFDVYVDGDFVACLDVAWPELRMGIEVDSRRWHLGHEAWERDSARYTRLVSFDWRILPVTSFQLRHRADEFAAQVLRLLGQRQFDLG